MRRDDPFWFSVCLLALLWILTSAIGANDEDIDFAEYCAKVVSGAWPDYRREARHCPATAPTKADRADGGLEKDGPSKQAVEPR